MKIKTNKKRIIISTIFLIIEILLISFNDKAYIIDNKFNYLLFSLSIFVCIVSSALFSIKLEANNKQNLIITIFSLILSFLFSYIIIELLNKNVLFNLYAKRLVFNFVVIILLHLLIYVITNKINLSIILSNSIIFILGIVNYTIVCFRGTPFVPWDILSIKTAAYVATSYTFQFSYHLVLGICLFIFIISIGLKANYKFKNQKANLIFRACSLIIILILLVCFYSTNMINYFDFENNLWKPKDEYNNNGFLASFLKQSKNLFNKKPDNYSIDNIENLLKDNSILTSASTTQSEDSPNIIVIMSESFCDLTVNR